MEFNNMLRWLCSFSWFFKLWSYVDKNFVQILTGRVPWQINVKQSHYRPWGFQNVEVPRLQDNWHMKVVRLSAVSTGHLYPQEIFLVLISVRGCVTPGARVRREGLCQWIIPVTPSGIEPATFWVVAQWLNPLRRQQRAAHQFSYEIRKV